MKKMTIGFMGGMLVLLLLTGCSGTGPSGHGEDNTLARQETDAGVEEEAEDMTEAAGREQQSELTQSEAEQSEPGPAVLLYQGQASIRIITDEGKVIYIDPYAGDNYGPEADLILVTHPHFDHSQTDKVENRKPDCQIITQNEAIREGEHQVFEFGYVTGDTSKTEQMPFQDVALSRLGMGNMRLPVQGDKAGAPIDHIRAQEIIDYAMENGINYFDSAYVYHGGESEKFLGEAMKKYPRDSYYFATKFLLSANPDYKTVFEEQLARHELTCIPQIPENTAITGRMKQIYDVHFTEFKFSLYVHFTGVY